MDNKIANFNEFLNTRFVDLMEKMNTAYKEEDGISLGFYNGGFMENERISKEFNKLFKEEIEERKTIYER